MKLTALLLTVCTCTLSAANFHWTASFSGPPVDGSHVIAPGTYVGTLDIFRVGSDDPTVILTLDPAFMPQSSAASWLPDPGVSQDWQQYLFSAGMSYTFDPDVLTGIVGRETWLKPFWLIGGTQYQAWVGSAFGEPVEFTIPDPPDGGDDGGGSGGGGEGGGDDGGSVPEPMHAGLAALALAAFAAGRRLCHA